MTAEVVYLSKSMRRENATHLHVENVLRYAPQLRVSINRLITQGKTSEKRLLFDTRRAVYGVARRWLGFYGFDQSSADKGNPYLDRVAQGIAEDLNFIVVRNDAMAQGEVTQLLTGATARERNKTLKEIAGLDPRSAKALARHRLKLQDEGMPKRDVDDSVGKYRNEMLRRRGNLVATTETTRLANEAHYYAVLDAGANGEVDLFRSTKTWLARTNACTVCKPLNGMTVPFSSTWPHYKGAALYPPIHPNCRCTFIVNPVKP